MPKRIPLIGQKVFQSDSARQATIKAFELSSAERWNEWRHTSNLFGDQVNSSPDLSRVWRQNFDFRDYLLGRTLFVRSDFSGSDFSGCNCENSDFHEAVLIGCNFKFASLRNSRLSRSFLRGADLSYADLSNCDLRRASLRDSTLIKTILRGADLSTTRGLEQNQIEEAIGDVNTILPPHLRYPASWDLPREDFIEGERDLLTAAPAVASLDVRIEFGILRGYIERSDFPLVGGIDPIFLKNEIISDIDQISPRCDNIPLLKRALDNYRSALSDQDFDVIMLGIRGEKIRPFGLVDGGAEDSMGLSSEVKAVVQGVIAQSDLLLSSYPKWRQFVRQPLVDEPSAEQKAAARSGTPLLIEDVRKIHELADKSVADILSSVFEEFNQMNGPEGLTTKNLMLSLHNFYRAITAYCIYLAKTEGDFAWSGIKEILQKRLGHAVFATLMAILHSQYTISLSQSNPNLLGFLVSFIVMLS